MKDKIIAFVKKETVLTIAWILAVISAFFIKPGIDYIGYIDFRSLGILWSLMIIMQGLSKMGFFDAIGQKLLSKTKRIYQLIAVLVFLCFFLSMFITNDVALITFVPFALFILKECNKENLFIPVIVLETLAANLGSMLTPIGNPQNLYLFGLSKLPLTDFIFIMLPYTLATFVLLCVSIFFIKGKEEKIIINNQKVVHLTSKKMVIMYAILFLISLLVVARVLDYYYLVALVLIIVFIFDKKTLISIDYALLFTFIGFFIFTGNLGNINAVKDVLTNLIKGNEVLMGVLSSQIISNVPAALLLSPFTNNYKDLIIGVNLGGLGTLIASMASLISFKTLAHNYNELKGKYFIAFTIMNIVYLLILLGLWMIIR